MEYGRNLFISQIEHTLIIFPCCKSIEDKTSSPNFPVDDAKFTYNQVFSFEYMQKNSFPCMSSQPAIHTSVLSKMKKKQQKAQTGFPSGQSGSQPVSKRTLRWGTRPLDQFLFWFPQLVFLALCLFHKGRDYNSKKGVKKYNLHMKQNDNLLVAAAGWLAEAWSRWCVPKTVWRVLHVLLLDYNTIKEHRNKNNNNFHERYRKGNRGVTIKRGYK